MNYINKDRSRYTPKNLKLPKIVLNDKEKNLADFFEQYRYKDEYHKNSTISKNA